MINMIYEKIRKYYGAWVILALIISLGIGFYFLNYSDTDNLIVSYDYNCFLINFCNSQGYSEGYINDLTEIISCRYYIMGETIPIYQRIDYKVDFQYIKQKYPECMR